jgi:hypothetical protein
MSKEDLCRKLELFIRGSDRSDRSLDLVGEIEDELRELYGDEEPYATVALALASYRPGGGDHLYDETAILPYMQSAWTALCSQSS